MPGKKRAPRVTVLPIAAATTNVARVPISAVAGAVSANETGRRPIEIIQSRLDTRPSSEEGTCRCLIVAQTMVPAASRALNTRQASINWVVEYASP